ncbi:hypothetical protein U4E84_11935 [Halorubrum sp. AD140]|uniref:hypothetical protein n=1 Tax=Halorubrum sp. AD140 TaxID=3050073 RepID=UPI002ACCC524|nr:hypothetical protein [Halorubrum sp. AD140]MDZ5812052.1 hypothetical protein [Halorubrum sp. AD140]
MDPPVVSADRLDGWRRVDQATDRAFVAGPVSVTASTVVYERAETPVPRPFCFASRLQIRPDTAPNAALTRLVERRARAGFRDRLAERGIETVERRGDREIAIDDPAASRASLWTFRGGCRIDADLSASDGARGADGGDGADGPVPVEALLAVWTTDEYLLAGGAYPLGDEAYPGGRTPDDARRELLGIVRGVRSPSGT